MQIDVVGFRELGRLVLFSASKLGPLQISLRGTLTIVHSTTFRNETIGIMFFGFNAHVCLIHQNEIRTSSDIVQRRPTFDLTYCREAIDGKELFLQRRSSIDRLRG